MVDRVEESKRRRTIFETKQEAEAEAARLRHQIGNAGAIWLSLPSSSRDQLVRFWQACQTRRLDMWDLVRAYDRRQIEVRQESPSLGSVVDELLAAKRAAGRSPRYADSLRLILGQFARGRESLPIATITVVDVDRWLESKNPAGRATFRARLSTLFGFAIRRQYRPDNPCNAIETPTVRGATPAIFTVRQTAKCLAALRRHAPRCLAWFVLTTFCGLRPEEAERTTWDAVQIDNGEAHVRVDAQTPKVRQRRIVTPLSAAIAWLKIAREVGSELPLPRHTRRRAIRRLRTVLRWTSWPKDVTRHTAASYWLALDGNPIQVAEQLGHSVAQLKTHYKALVTRAEAERFFRLVPVRYRRQISGTARQ
jgi:integrase